MLPTQILFLNLAFLMVHPFHVSVCDVEYNESTHSLEITHKFFLDDLEEALNKHNDLNLDLLAEPNTERFDSYLRSYIEEKFSLSGNGKVLNLKYLGSEINEDAIRCYLEAEQVGSFNEATVINGALFEVFDDQQNLVHFRNQGKVRSILISKGNPVGSVHFKD